MAKRVSPDEKAFNPVEEALVRSALEPINAEIERPTGSTTLAKTRAEVSEQEAGQPPPAPVLPKVVSIETGRKAQAPSGSAGLAKEVEKLSRVKRFLLTDGEDDILEQLVSDVGRRLGTPLTLSHLLRATATLLMHSRDEILKLSGKMGGLKRPSNNDPVAIASFEHNITRLIDRAIRNSRVPE